MSWLPRPQHRDRLAHLPLLLGSLLGFAGGARRRALGCRGLLSLACAPGVSGSLLGQWLGFAYGWARSALLLFLCQGWGWVYTVFSCFCCRDFLPQKKY